MDAKEYNKIMERLDFIEFRQQLLFDNDDVSRSIFEYGLTREQYKRIMALMQDYRERIERGEKCGHGGFEQAMYEIVPDHRGYYHMCEELAKGFRDENRWVIKNKLVVKHLPVIHMELPVFDRIRLVRRRFTNRFRFWIKRGSQR